LKVGNRFAAFRIHLHPLLIEFPIAVSGGYENRGFLCKLVMFSIEKLTESSREMISKAQQSAVCLERGQLETLKLYYPTFR